MKSARIFLLAMAMASVLRGGPMEEAQVETLYDQALQAFQKGNYTSTVDLLEQARDLVPTDSQVNLLAGVAYCSLGEFEKAKKPLKLVLKKDPANADAGVNLGIANFETGHWKAARRAFETVLENNPGHAQARINMGILSLKDENWEEARGHFDEAVRLAPKDTRAWVGLSDALTWLNQNAAAADARRKALKLNPRDDTIRLKLAGSLYTLGKNKEVLKTLAGLKSTRYPEAYFLFGIAYYRQGKFSDSESAFLKALDLKPDFPKARLNLGVTYYDQGDYEKAIEQFEKILETHPRDAEAKQSLAVAREVAAASLAKKGTQEYVAGHYQRALKIWRRVLAFDPKNKVVMGLEKTAQQRLKGQADQRAQRGMEQLSAGRMGEALKAFNDALDMDPGNAQAQRGLDKAAQDPLALAKGYEKVIESALAARSFKRASRMAEEVKAVSPSVGRRFLKKIENARAKWSGELAAKGDKAFGSANWRTAADSYEAALELDPGSSRIRRRLLQSRASLRQEVDKLIKKARTTRDHNEAYSIYSRALDLDPHNRIAAEGARREAKKARLERADPEKVNQVYFKGVYAYANGDTEKAIELWEKALVMDPQHQQARQAVEEARRKLKAITELDRKS